MAYRILRFTQGKSLDDYLAGVERQLTILGEALSQVRRVEPTVADGVTDWSRGPLPAMLAALEAL